MGIIILITTIIFELVFTTFCIIKRSNPISIRNTIRITAFPLFVFFTLVSVIRWSFRYWLLAAFLLVLFIIGIVNLIRNNEKKKKYSSLKITGKSLFMIILLFLVSLPAIIFPQIKHIKPTGEYKVKTVKYTYVDKNRVETYTNTGEFREVNVEYWYPENAEGTFPLVVFSHGTFGVKASNYTLFNELASHGYVVCSIDHPYHSFETVNENGKITLVDRSLIEEYKEFVTSDDLEMENDLINKWMDIRTGDMNFVIDTVIDKAANGSTDMPYPLVNTDKIGLSGHSLGGSAALGLGRTRNDISAVIALESPYFGDITGYDKDGFIFTKETYPVPVLNIYSDSTWGQFQLDSKYQQNQNLLTDTKAEAFQVYIKGSLHMDLCDLSIISPILADMLDNKISKVNKPSKINKYDCLRTINHVSLEFFDCYLKGKGTFQSEGTY